MRILLLGSTQVQTPWKKIRPLSLSSVIHYIMMVYDNIIDNIGITLHWICSGMLKIKFRCIKGTAQQVKVAA